MFTRLIALTREGIAQATGTISPEAIPLDSTGDFRVVNYPTHLPLICLADAHALPAINHPDALLVGTHGQGVWLSTDVGQTWENIGLGGIIIKSLTVTATHILAGTKNPALIFTSADGGTTWEELPGFREIPSRPLWFSPAEKPYTAYVQGLDHVPGNPNHLLAGIEAGAVVHSFDGGATWSDHLPNTMRDCHAVGFHPTDARYAYAVGGNEQGAAMSRDGGATWQDCRDGLQHHYGWAFAAHPQNPECWFISVAPGPRQAHSDDGRAEAHIYRHSVTRITNTVADTWEQLGIQSDTGLPVPLTSMPYTLIAPPEEPGALYAGLRNGQIYYSPDCGDSWQRLPVQFDGICRTLLVQLHVIAA